MRNRTIAGTAALFCSALLMAAPPARADELAELDQLSRASAAADEGVSLAQEQIGRGALLAAAATLQRVMLDHPEALAAQLLHAGLLCRLDDRTGASVEFEALRRKDFKEQDWNAAMALCAEKPGGA